MIKAWLLRFHRWTSLLFSLPLLAIIITGLILSFEPIIQANNVLSNSLQGSQISDLLKRHDPEGKARAITLNQATRRLTLRGLNEPVIDWASGERWSGASTWDVFLWARLTHEKLLGQQWLVVTATIAMIVIMALGLLMGWPKFKNSLKGWHQGTAWCALPLLFLSPLTGLMMAYGLTFQGAMTPQTGKPISIYEAVRVVEQSRDFSQVSSIAPRGGRMMLRIFEEGELRAYTVNPEGLIPLPRNWPRLIHEGNWSSWTAGLANATTSMILIGLLSTGLFIWGRRKFLRRQVD